MMDALGSVHAIDVALALALLAVALCSLAVLIAANRLTVPSIMDPPAAPVGSRRTGRGLVDPIPVTQEEWNRMPRELRESGFYQVVTR